MLISLYNNSEAKFCWTFYYIRVVFFDRCGRYVYLWYLFLYRHKLPLSDKKYRTLKDVQADCLEMPTEYAIKKMAAELKIPFQEFMGGIKTNLKQNLKITLERRLKVVGYVSDGSGLKAKIDPGFDG